MDERIEARIAGLEAEIATLKAMVPAMRRPRSRRAALQNIAATTVVGCGPSATIQILSNTVTDFVVDVIGFYQEQDRW